MTEVSQEQDAIISFLNSNADDYDDLAPVARASLLFEQSSSSAPPPPPLKVSVESASSSEEEEEEDDHAPVAKIRLASRRRPLAASLGAHELMVKTTGLLLPRWPPAAPASMPFKSPSPSLLKSPPLLGRESDGGLAFPFGPAVVSPEGSGGGGGGGGGGESPNGECDEDDEEGCVASLSGILVCLEVSGTNPPSPFFFSVHPHRYAAAPLLEHRGARSVLSSAALRRRWRGEEGLW